MFFFTANLLHTPRIQNIGEYAAAVDNYEVIVYDENMRMIVDASRIVQLRVRIDHSKVKIEF